MGFISTDFTFNSIPSTPYGIQLVKLDDGMIGEILSNEREIKETFVAYRDIPWFYKVDQKAFDLKMSFTSTTSDFWSLTNRKLIFNWLFAPRTYKDFISADNPSMTYKLIFV